ncbi:MAG: aromatic amino acid lyase [Myxococcota bacterium]
MLPQVAAAAAVAAARQLMFPNSADTVPTCEDQEDHVAMSTSAARRAHDVLLLAQQVVAIELLCAVRGLHLLLEAPAHRGAALGAGTRAAFELLRPQLGSEAPADDIAIVLRHLRDGSLVAAAAAAAGPLPPVVDHA